MLHSLRDSAGFAVVGYLQLDKVVVDTMEASVVEG